MQFDYTLFDKYPNEISIQEFHGIEEAFFEENSNNEIDSINHKIKLTYNEAIKEIQNYFDEKYFISKNKYKLPRFLGAALDKNVGSIFAYIRNKNFRTVKEFYWSIENQTWIFNQNFRTLEFDKDLTDEDFEKILDKSFLTNNSYSLRYKSSFHNCSLKFDNQNYLDFYVCKIFNDGCKRYESLSRKIYEIKNSEYYSNYYQDHENKFRHAILPNEILTFKEKRIPSAQSISH